ncbi:transposase [Streptomyces sp. NPDC006691]|uniref:transposase n=1 Tax=Streptomyces sp. NPDC006691 TaxID=3364757 RepID=UPI00367AA570
MDRNRGTSPCPTPSPPPDRRSSQRFKKFLTKLGKEVPADLQVHRILDNYATHKTPDLKRWLLTHPRFHLHFTSTSASWLNLVGDGSQS